MFWFFVGIILIALCIDEYQKNYIKKKKVRKIEMKFSKSSNSAYYNNTKFGEQTILKKLLIQERGPWCEICFSDGPLQVHHLIPISKGGSNEDDNLKLLCYNCHLKNHQHEFVEINNNRRRIPEKYIKIRNAIRDNKKLQIKYKSYYGDITIREISPKEIIEKKGIHYINSFCHLRKEDREFRISRIMNIKIIEI